MEFKKPSSALVSARNLLAQAEANRPALGKHAHRTGSYQRETPQRRRVRRPKSSVGLRSALEIAANDIASKKNGPANEDGSSSSTGYPPPIRKSQSPVRRKPVQPNSTEQSPYSSNLSNKITTNKNSAESITPSSSEARASANSRKAQRLGRYSGMGQHGSGGTRAAKAGPDHYDQPTNGTIEEVESGVKECEKVEVYGQPSSESSCSLSFDTDSLVKQKAQMPAQMPKKTVTTKQKSKQYESCDLDELITPVAANKQKFLSQSDSQESSDDGLRRNTNTRFQTRHEEVKAKRSVRQVPDRRHDPPERDIQVVREFTPNKNRRQSTPQAFKPETNIDIPLYIDDAPAPPESSIKPSPEQHMKMTHQQYIYEILSRDDHRASSMDTFDLLDDCNGQFDDEEPLGPMEYGVLSRLAQQTYKNKKLTCSYQHRHSISLPLLSTTVDINAAERAWFYINTFLELDLNTIPIQTTSGMKQTIDLQLSSNGSSCGSSTSSTSNEHMSRPTHRDYHPAYSKGSPIPHLQNDDNLSVINSSCTDSVIASNSAENNRGGVQSMAHLNGNTTAYASILSSKDPLELCQGLSLIGLSKVYNYSIRDEIFCQLLKQITDHPNKQNQQNGWVLMALVCSSFAPSANVSFFLKEYFDTCDGDMRDQARYCAARLRECEQQRRENPPCSIELVAARLCTKCRVPVISMDQSIKTLISSPSLTARELCDLVAEKNRMKDNFGFSIFIALGTRFAPVGCGDVIVMDAICQAERYARANGIHEVWRLYFRKDLFSPNYLAARHDTIALNLIFTQICGGVKVGEYECTTPQDLALLVAHQYCVQFPLFEDDVQDGRLKEICEQTMPDTTYHKYKKQWHKMIKKTLEALRQESAAGVPYSYQTDSLDTAYRSLSTTSSSEAEFGSTDGAGLILDPRTRLINKIKEQVIKYAVMAWHEKFQRIYPINGCESYSLKGTLTQRWQGSGRIYLSHKRITVIADSYFPSFPTQHHMPSASNNSNARHTLIDVPVTDIIAVYEVPDPKQRPPDKWKAQEKEKEKTSAELLEARQLQANIYKPKIRLKIDGGYMYTLSTPFHVEITQILRRFVWEVGKRKAAMAMSKREERGDLEPALLSTRIELKVSKLGVEIVQQSLRNGEM